jgi:hypothetical protein
LRARWAEERPVGKNDGDSDKTSCNRQLTVGPGWLEESGADSTLDINLATFNADPDCQYFEHFPESTEFSSRELG